MNIRKVTALLLALLLAAVFPGCDSAGASTADAVLGRGGRSLRILSGSENQELETILEEFAKAEGIRIEMTYQGSLDIMAGLGGGELPLRCRLAGQLSVVGRGGHTAQFKARRVRFHYASGVRHPGGPGSRAGPCGERDHCQRFAAAYSKGRAEILHDQRHSV